MSLRSIVRIVITALAAMLLAIPALAHEFYLVVGKDKIPLPKQQVLLFDPISVIYVPKGGTAKLLIEDPGTCAANLTATILQGAGSFTVSANPSNPVKTYTYTFSGQQFDLGVVNIQVIGSGGACNENTNNLFYVAVVDQKTADKEIKNLFKSELSAYKAAMKGLVSDFGQATAGILGDAADGSISIEQAYEELADAFEFFLDFSDDAAADRLDAIYAAARAILLSSGYDDPTVAPPSIVSSEDCSPYRMTIDAMHAEAQKSYNSSNKVLKKALSSLLKLSKNHVAMCVSTTPLQVANGPAIGIGPTAQQQTIPLTIRSVNCKYIAELGSRTITVKGRADVAQGNQVTVQITGPANSNGNRAYSTSVVATVGSDGKWEVVYQDSSIIAGTGTVTATHPTGTTSKTYTCN